MSEHRQSLSMLTGLCDIRFSRTGGLVPLPCLSGDLPFYPLKTDNHWAHFLVFPERPHMSTVQGFSPKSERKYWMNIPFFRSQLFLNIEWMKLEESRAICSLNVPVALKPGRRSISHCVCLELLALSYTSCPLFPGRLPWANHHDFGKKIEASRKSRRNFICKIGIEIANSHPPWCSIWQANIRGMRRVLFQNRTQIATSEYALHSGEQVHNRAAPSRGIRVFTSEQWKTVWI